MPGSEQTLWDADVDEEARVAAVLERIFFAMGTALVILTIFQVAAAGFDPLVTVNLVVIALLAALRVAVRRGHVRVVSVGLLVALWLLVTLAVWFDGGVQSPSMAAYMLILTIAALLLRTPALWTLLGLSLAATGAVTWAGLVGALPPAQAADTPLRAMFVHVVHLIGAALFLFMAVESLQRARERARRNHERATGLLEQLGVEKRRADELLHNILPEAVADQLKREIRPIAERFEAATVLFADLAHFTRFAADRPPEAVVELLNDIFSRFDRLADEFALEKIKTIGDAYMVVSGIPTPRPDHVAAMADMAVAMRAEFDRFAAERGLDLGIRIGIHTGPVVAGVIGRRKFIYDLWGDTVNVASRMESGGIIGEIQVTEAVARALDGRFSCAPRGTIPVKGKEDMPVFLLQPRA